MFYPGVSEVAEVADVKQFSNENLWKLDEIQNLASVTSEGAQWIFSKITFLKSVHQAEKNEL